MACILAGTALTVKVNINIRSMGPISEVDMVCFCLMLLSPLITRKKLPSECQNEHENYKWMQNRATRWTATSDSTGSMSDWSSPVHCPDSLSTTACWTRFGSRTRTFLSTFLFILSSNSQRTFEQIRIIWFTALISDSYFINGEKSYIHDLTVPNKLVRYLLPSLRSRN